jgi:hypothetical protein
MNALFRTVLPGFVAALLGSPGFAQTTQGFNPLLGAWRLAPMGQQSPQAQELLQGLRAYRGFARSHAGETTTLEVGPEGERGAYYALNRFEFTAASMHQRSRAQQVMYRVEGDRVIVTDEQGLGTEWRVNGGVAHRMHAHPYQGTVAVKYLRAR